MRVTKSTHVKLMATLSAHGMQPRRHAICWEASAGRAQLKQQTESSRELTEAEALAVIGHFNAKANAVRRKMIGLGKSMKWGTTTATILPALDAWCLKHTAYKKPLMKLTMAELTKACTILETKVYPDYLKALKKNN